MLSALFSVSCYLNVKPTEQRAAPRHRSHHQTYTSTAPHTVLRNSRLHALAFSTAANSAQAYQCSIPVCSSSPKLALFKPLVPHNTSQGIAFRMEFDDHTSAFYRPLKHCFVFFLSIPNTTVLPQQYLSISVFTPSAWIHSLHLCPATPLTLYSADAVA